MKQRKYSISSTAETRIALVSSMHIRSAFRSISHTTPPILGKLYTTTWIALGSTFWLRSVTRRRSNCSARLRLRRCRGHLSGGKREKYHSYCHPRRKRQKEKTEYSPVNIALIRRQHVIHKASKYQSRYNRYQGMDNNTSTMLLQPAC